MDFVGCFSSFEGNQWLNSSKFWNKCVRYSVEVCHRLRLSTISLPFSLVWALCSGYPATHVGPDKTDWYTFRNIPTSNVPVGINWCQQFPSKVQSGKCITWIRHTSHSKQPIFSASWFCLVRTYNSVSKCGLKADDYSGDVFRSLVTTERWTSWSSCGLKEEAIQVFCHQLRLFLVCESGSRKISGFPILCKSLSLSLHRHSMQVWSSVTHSIS